MGSDQEWEAPEYKEERGGDETMQQHPAISPRDRWHIKGSGEAHFSCFLPLLKSLMGELVGTTLQFPCSLGPLAGILGS